MTALQELARVRMEERRLLALPCARCSHPLRQHSLIDNRCKHHTIVPHASKNPERARLRYCKCKTWVESDAELALK